MPIMAIDVSNSTSVNRRNVASHASPNQRNENQNRQYKSSQHARFSEHRHRRTLRASSLTHDSFAAGSSLALRS